MFTRWIFTLMIAALVPVSPASVGLDQAHAQTLRQGSGLPLPRYVSLRAAEINLRTGPGVQYPIEWVYKRQHLPVEIIAEFRTWRKIRDWQGAQGWVHQGMLAGQRYVIVTGALRTLRAEANVKSKAVAKLENGVIARLKQCPTAGSWCEIEVGKHQGWLRKVEFWGVYPKESYTK
ncbi:MAG: SH3 domain-containing protein [Rhodospirillales bacterium]|jgi:SH3-like domain-containing protein